MKKLIYLPVFLFLAILFLLTGCSLKQNVSQIQEMNELEYPFDTQTITLKNGIEVAYMDEGKGPKTLLMIHGLGSYAPAWKKNIETLSGEYRCVAVDLPGYGKSSKGNYAGSMRFYADVVKEVTDKLELENVVLMGHSMGGQISMVASLAYPETYKELILVAPAGFETFSAGQKQWFRDVLTPRAVALTPVDAIKANIGSNFYHMPKEANFMIYDRIAMRNCADFGGYCYIIPQCVQGMVNEPVFDFLPNLKARTLVIYGNQDNLIPNRFLHGGSTRKIAEDGASRIPDCQLEMVDKAGHFVQFEQYEVVNDHILNFLNPEAE